jgi:hypothetical protein
MTEYNPRKGKRKGGVAGIGDDEARKKLRMTSEEMVQLESLVATTVQQLYSENSESFQGFSSGFSELPQENFESLIWTASFTDSQPSSFPGSQEEWSFTSSPTQSDFGDSVVPESPFSPESPGLQDTEDVVMSSQPGEDDNSVETPVQTGEESPIEVEYVINRDYVSQMAEQHFNEIWEESLLTVVDMSDFSWVAADPEVLELRSDFLREVEEYISSVLTEGSQEGADGTWEPSA